MELRPPPPSAGWSLYNDQVSRWAYVNNAFSKEECEQIISYGKSFQLTKGTITSGDPKIYRDSNIVFINPEPQNQWIYRKLVDHVFSLQQYFNFELTGFNENLQFTEYVAPTGHYDYHVDRVYAGVIRKLSVVLQLTDASTYEGGEFEYLDSKEAEILPKTQGTLLAFPSFAMHRVTPVTKGSRYSLVGWLSGPQFK